MQTIRTKVLDYEGNRTPLIVLGINSLPISKPSVKLADIIIDGILTEESK